MVELCPGEVKSSLCVALSTAEAEYIALSAAAQELLWQNQLISELTTSENQKITILEDNQSAIVMTTILSFMDVPNILLLFLSEITLTPETSSSCIVPVGIWLQTC